MKAKDLKNFLSEIPDDLDLVIAKPVVIDEDDQLYGIVDIPICGIVLNDSEDNEPKELRFVLDINSIAIKNIFKPGEITPIEEVQL